MQWKAIKIIYEQLDEMRSGKFSDEDLNIAKRTIISAIKGIQDEQSAEITYFPNGKVTSWDNLKLAPVPQRIRTQYVFSPPFESCALPLKLDQHKHSLFKAVISLGSPLV